MYTRAHSSGMSASLTLLAATALLAACAEPEPAADDERAALFGHLPDDTAQPAMATRLPEDLRRALERRNAEARSERFERAERAPWDELPMRAPLPAGAEAEAGDPCTGSCGGDRFCIGMCLLGDPPIRRDDEVACLECGRETGFRGRPDLRVVSQHQGAALLEWEPVDEVDHYVVHGVRWHASHTAGLRSVEHTTRDTSLRVDIDSEYVYMFYVVGWDAEHKQSTRPSNPVVVEPD